jgi:hypothetical protein
LFSAGTVNLDMTSIEDNSQIEHMGSLLAAPRESDAVAWIGTEPFATAGKSAMDSGGRCFSFLTLRATLFTRVALKWMIG